MVLGYICNEHGYQRECDLRDGGQRICPECGADVTGLVGRSRSTARSPPEDDPRTANGTIEWYVHTNHSTRAAFTVEAFDHEAAVEAAIGRVETPQQISEVKPANRRYRY